MPSLRQQTWRGGNGWMRPEWSTPAATTLAAAGAPSRKDLRTGTAGSFRPPHGWGYHRAACAGSAETHTPQPQPHPCARRVSCSITAPTRLARIGRGWQGLSVEGDVFLTRLPMTHTWHGGQQNRQTSYAPGGG